MQAPGSRHLGPHELPRVPVPDSPVWCGDMPSTSLCSTPIFALPCVEMWPRLLPDCGPAWHRPPPATLPCVIRHVAASGLS